MGKVLFRHDLCRQQRSPPPRRASAITSLTCHTRTGVPSASPVDARTAIIGFNFALIVISLYSWGGYAVIRNTGDDRLVCVLVVCLYPFKIFLSCVAPNKGVHDYAVKRLAKFINDCGLVKFSYRSDREPSIVSMFENACVLSGRQGTNISEPVAGPAPDDTVFDFVTVEGIPGDLAPASLPPAGSGDSTTVVAVPEHSHPGSLSRTAKRRHVSRP